MLRIGGGGGRRRSRTVGVGRLARIDTILARNTRNVPAGVRHRRLPSARTGGLTQPLTYSIIELSADTSRAIIGLHNDALSMRPGRRQLPPDGELARQFASCAS